MNALDADVAGRIDVANADALTKVLRDLGNEPVRACGAASSLARLPVPARRPWLLRLSPMNAIVRLDAGDLTCSVQPGVTRAQLEAELARHRLVLPCLGEGSLGGLLARGEFAPPAPGQRSARDVVLGLEGVLADGSTFKSGARVVKSVAGFDLHRAFVGSRGRLFVATLLHLRLQPAPRACRRFAEAARPLADALARFHRLRLLPAPPSALWLTRSSDGSATVHGRVEGAKEHVDALVRALDLDITKADDERDGFTLEPVGDCELLDGQVPPSRLAALFSRLPAHAPVRVGGTGQFHAVLRPQESDDALALLPALHGVGEIRRGAPARRGRATTLDAGAAALESRLRAALDPHGRLQ